MKPQLYKTRDIVNVAAHLLISGGLAAATLFIAQPLLVAGVVVTALVFFSRGTHKAAELQEKAKKYPDSLPESPNLGAIVKELYKTSGMPKDPDPQTPYPVYDMKLDPVKMEYETGALAKYLTEIGEHMSKACIAMVTNNGKTIVSISRPLMKVLTDEEEKSVLAHEFGHAAAKHHSISRTSVTLENIAVYASKAAKITAVIGTGWQAALAGAACYVFARNALKKVIPNGNLINKKEKDLPFKDAIKRLKAENRRDALTEAFSAAVLTAISPAYAGVWATAKGIRLASIFAVRHLSRRCEYQADRGAVALGGNPLALITALRKGTRVNEQSLEEAFKGPIPQPDFLSRIWKKMTAKHPPVEKRLERLGDIARKNGYTEEAIQEAIHGDIKVNPEVIVPPETLLAMTKLFQKK